MASPPVEVSNDYPFIVLMKSKYVSKLFSTALMGGRSEFLEVFDAFGVT